LWPQVLTKRLKHSAEKYKDLQVNYDELKMFSEKVHERRLNQRFLLGGQRNPMEVREDPWADGRGSVDVFIVKILNTHNQSFWRNYERKIKFSPVS
jgi:hypothetical protein